MNVSGIGDKSEAHQVSSMVYMMGDGADDILHSQGLTDVEKRKYKTLTKKFEDYFVKFNQRNQKEGESINSFVTDLHVLA